MDFRIADTFTDSLARLTGEEQKAVKTTAFDLQLNPSSPGLSFHKLDKAKDKRFWSVRANEDIRLIVHRSESSLLLCYVDHHDKAYAWAERRKLETHPTTGAAQLVEIRETVKEIVVPVYVQRELPLAKAAPSEDARLFAELADEELLGYGVPVEWLPDVRSATGQTLYPLAEHLPAEAAEALFEIATGGTPRVHKPAAAAVGPFDHPEAQRRFRIMSNVEELERALDAPWEKWTVFLHPEQRQLVEREYAGPARVSGSAGTGKTIVALHRAVHLARSHPAGRVLLTTFSDTLGNALRSRLKRLLGNEPRLAERIDVHSLDAIALRLFKAHVGTTPAIADSATVRTLIGESSKSVSGHKFGIQFLVTEWDQVVDAWQLETWDAYRDVARLGRKTRLAEPQRRLIWSIFEAVRAELQQRALMTRPQVFNSLAQSIAASGKAPFDFVVADEAQDLSVAHLRFLAALGRGRPDGLFFAGDIGQRIFQQPFSWKALGVEIRGRSRALRVNYRTSHQIRTQADRLLGPVLTDVDGNSEKRNDTVSVFNGPAPVIRTFAKEHEELRCVAGWLEEQSRAGVQPHELGVFVRSDAELPRARRALAEANMTFRVLDEHVDMVPGHVSLSTMHLAKGLEFRAVAVMACDDEVIPSQQRIETVGDDTDLQEIYDTERHLLYVACTRARDALLLTSTEPSSEFLLDMTA